jgi:nicotinamide-nucleotide amidase
MKAHIVNIGDELLIGQTVNTNASWMGQILDANGIQVRESVAISDNKLEIIKAIENAAKVADVVLITGGLGPTKDDITKHTLCEYFGSTLVRNEEVYREIKAYFTTRGRAMLQVNEDQALLPDNCAVLINTKGTASGMWFEKNGVIYVSLPGVPYEMRYLMVHEVMPRLIDINNFNIHHETIKTIGIGESYLAEKIKDWETRLLAEGLKLAYLPSPGIVKLRISSFGKSNEENLRRVQSYSDELRKLVPQYIFGRNKEKLAEIVGELLAAQNKTVGFCESCTGGYLSHLMTEISGSSRYYNGSVVCYTNHLKNKLLNVSLETLETKGAVSEEVVKEMVLGGLNTLEVDYTIAISGVAGPNGGTDLKPVGMVCVGVGNKDEVKTFTFQFGNDRGRNITMSAIFALNELRKFLIKA